MLNERNILWRQGNILSKETMNALDVTHLESTEKILGIIVSHDCDLANVQESYIEVIYGRSIEAPNGNFTHAKNARKLHLEFKLDEKPVTIELIAEKSKILKQTLINHYPRKGFQLETKSKNILQRWLAARYRRAAFPDEFNNRLKKTGLGDQLTKILRPQGSYIPAIFFDIDAGEEIEREQFDDPYILTIIVLYTTDNDYDKASKAAIQIQQQIEKVFREKLKSQNSNEWQYIELKDCIVMSDEALTYRQSTLFKQWRLEHMSLKEDPVQPILEH